MFSLAVGIVILLMIQLNSAEGNWTMFNCLDS